MVTKVEFDQAIQSLTDAMNNLRGELLVEFATKAYITEYIDHMVGDLIPIADAFTENSQIAGYERLNIEKALKHFPLQYYNINDLRSILMDYNDAAQAGNINPYIALAQMVKETDWTRSWWARRPRRNPAGLGITGRIQKDKPNDIHAWVYDENDEVWKQGYVFPSWKVASQAHIGHLLAYLYTDDALSSDQRYLVDQDPKHAAIINRGEVKYLKDLDGKWSIPGIGYGRSLATLANAIKR